MPTFVSMEVQGNGIRDKHTLERLDLDHDGGLVVEVGPDVTNRRVNGGVRHTRDQTERRGRSSAVLLSAELGRGDDMPRLLDSLDLFTKSAPDIDSPRH